LSYLKDESRLVGNDSDPGDERVDELLALLVARGLEQAKNQS
jgi:hypothetical protein